MKIMTRKHPQWNEFCDRLEGKEGCNFRKEKTKNHLKGEIVWKCAGGMNKDLSTKILKKYYPDINIPKTMKYFEKLGGHCDCEVLFNVNI